MAPVFLAMIIGGIASALTGLVGRVLLALGMGFVTYTGLDIALDALKTLFFEHAGALPAQIVGMLGVLKVGTCINILFACVAVRLTLDGLSPDGAIKKFVLR